ncbi:hypothetical protein LTR78_010452 [Recurvomyces mirabilis]|uniref:Enoyl reductase (ER) domain-containing protein n=1 Tax=Recurvomyces mirabilis TaxID=574656 RepID=A0AAE0WHZ9_9PEZI|nr:hypothetical protein LTR78_010452 [Recurvomyces mirabilis]KAK5150531.1 hypothetical protein LTS14_010024 [Recurvomyces mirabilis]
MTSKPTIPSTMKAWQYTDVVGGLEKNLELKSVPMPERKPNQHLVQVTWVSTNPVDYKPAEIGMINRFMIPKPATPGLDLAGRIVAPAAGSSLKAGDLVYGCTGQSIFAGGSLREYAIVADSKAVVAAPEGVSAKDLSTIGVAGVTALQSIKPFVKKGDKVFINGGSGGVGIFAIQLAKAYGLSVTTTCSTANVEFCRSLGADQVIDYKKENLVEALKKSGPYDHVVDNVGADYSLFFKVADFTKPAAKYAFVGATPSFGLVGNLSRAALPRIMGGAGRKIVPITSVSLEKDLIEVADHIKSGQVKVFYDFEYTFENVRDAFARQKTGRARGKIVVQVNADA